MQNLDYYEPYTIEPSLETSLNEINAVHNEIAKQFPTIFDNIVKVTLNTATSQVLQNHLLVCTSTLQNLK